MARKHNLKRNRVAQPVDHIKVSDEVTSRAVVTDPSTGELVVKHTVIQPARFTQGKAQGSTKQRVPRKGRRSR